MPLYEYQCRKCGHRFERIQQFSDKPLRRCPKCKTGRVEKLPSAPAVQFKGTGWYVTDYGAKGKADRAEKARTEASEKSAGGKSDAGGKGDSGKADAGKSDSGKSDSGKDSTPKGKSSKA